MSNFNYGDYSTRSLKLTADLPVPVGAYAEVYSFTTGLETLVDYYNEGETILSASYPANTLVILFENDI